MLHKVGGLKISIVLWAPIAGNLTIFTLFEGDFTGLLIFTNQLM